MFIYSTFLLPMAIKKPNNVFQLPDIKVEKRPSTSETPIRNITRPLISDEEIVVSIDYSGHKWTVGDVRRVPVHEDHTTTVGTYPPLAHVNRGIGTAVPSSVNRSKEQPFIYNRVPKCASSTVTNVIAVLSHFLNYTYTSSNIFWSSAKSESEERKFAAKMAQHPAPWGLDKHVYFIDTSRYIKNFEVNWINIIRNPVDRYVSSFYYLRSLHRWSRSQQHRPDQAWFNKDLSECILNKDPECKMGTDHLIEQQLTYFCGSAIECRQVGNGDAVRVAMYNAERYYSVIGVTEHLQVSLAVLEGYLPRYFKGALWAYYRLQQSDNGKANETPNKKELTAAAKKELKKRLVNDIDFYEFAYQRLQQQVRRLQKNNKMQRRNSRKGG